MMENTSSTHLLQNIIQSNSKIGKHLKNITISKDNNSKFFLHNNIKLYFLKSPSQTLFGYHTNINDTMTTQMHLQVATCPIGLHVFLFLTDVDQSIFCPREGY